MTDGRSPQVITKNKDMRIPAEHQYNQTGNAPQHSHPHQPSSTHSGPISIQRHSTQTHAMNTSAPHIPNRNNQHLTNVWQMEMYQRSACGLLPWWFFLWDGAWMEMKFVGLLRLIWGLWLLRVWLICFCVASLLFVVIADCKALRISVFICSYGKETDVQI